MPTRFTDLVVWQKSVSLVAEVYRATTPFPPHERYGLTAQMRRAAVSIPSNIAEGHGRATRGEYINQLSVARGSLHEVETLLLIASQLGFADDSGLASARSLVNEVERMLARLRTRLREKGKG